MPSTAVLGIGGLGVRELVMEQCLAMVSAPKERGGGGQTQRGHRQHPRHQPARRARLRQRRSFGEVVHPRLVEQEEKRIQRIDAAGRTR